MDKIKRREWLTRALAALVALGLLSLGGLVQKVQAGEKHIVINVQTKTTYPDREDISVSEQDSVVWRSSGNRKFCITKFTLPDGTVENPFHRPLPFCSTWRKLVSSGPAKKGMEDEYKYTIEVKKGPDIDPHIRIHP